MQATTTFKTGIMFLLTGALFLSIASAPKIYKKDNISFEGKIACDSKTGLPITGIMQRHYPEGRLEEQEYKDGRSNGRFKIYHKNGALQYDMLPIDEYHNSIVKVYDKTGKLIGEEVLHKIDPITDGTSGSNQERNIQGILSVR